MSMTTDVKTMLDKLIELEDQVKRWSAKSRSPARTLPTGTK